MESSSSSTTPFCSRRSLSLRFVLVLLSIFGFHELGILQKYPSGATSLGPSLNDSKDYGMTEASKGRQPSNSTSHSMSIDADARAGVSQNDTSGPLLPRIVMLLSFPNSGTSYTLVNLRHVTGYAFADIYNSREHKWPPLYPDVHPYGPYVDRGRGWPIPSNYILTKSHCTGYSDKMAPYKYIVHSTSWFAQECRSPNVLLANHTKTKVPFPVQWMAKAIHLIRHPRDNLVARFHLGIQARLDDPAWKDVDPLFFSNEKGFRRWCRYIDNMHNDEWLVDDEEARKNHSPLDSTTRQLGHDLPCRDEWVRYVQWHNHVTAWLAQDFAPDKRMVLYYEDYSLHYNATLQKLLDMVELPAVNTAKEFRANKTYENYFSVEELAQAGRLVKHFATPETWELLRHYF